MLTNIGKVFVTGILGNILGIGLAVHYYYLGYYGAMATAIPLAVISGVVWLGSVCWVANIGGRHLFIPDEEQGRLTSNQKRLDFLEKEIKRITSYQDDMYNKLLDR